MPFTAAARALLDRVVPFNVELAVAVSLMVAGLASGVAAWVLAATAPGLPVPWWQRPGVVGSFGAALMVAGLLVLGR